MLDFTKLLEEELDFFLKVYKTDIDNLTYDNKIIKSEKLFNKLEKNPLSLYPYPVIDLYIASKRLNDEQQYEINDINNLSDRKKEEFAKVLYLDVSQDNFIERLIRILGFLGLITYDYVLYGLIVKEMDYVTIKSLCIASKDLENMCSREDFWRNLYNDRYGRLTEEKESEKDYEKLFIIKEIQEDFLPYLIKASDIYVGKSFETNTFLTRLYLSYYKNIGDEEAEVIGKSLETNTSLIELYLDNNQIGDEGVKAIGKSLEINTSLIKLELINNQIGDKGVKAIGDSLKTNTSLTELGLNYNKIGDEGVAAIGEGLETNTSLTELYLNHNQIGDGVKAIGKSLETNTSLTKLDLSSNKIRDEGAKAIGKSLETNTSLTKLNLDHNKIRDEGAKAIGKSLETNTSLTELNLSYNKIGEEGGVEIGNGLETNTSLTTLYLGFNKIRAPEFGMKIGNGLEIFDKIELLMERNRNLK